MPGSFNDLSTDKRSEIPAVATLVRGRRTRHSVVGTIKNDGWHPNRRPLRKEFLDLFETRVARRVVVSVPIRMNDHIDEVRVVERARSPVERLVGKSPRRRPRFPKQPAQAPTIGFESCTTTLGVEVPLIPKRPFAFRCGGLRRHQRVLNGVSANDDRGADSLWMKGGGDARGPTAPVVAGDGKTLIPSVSTRSMRSWPSAACWPIRGTVASRTRVRP